MAEIRFHLLGPLRIWRGETEIKITSKKQRTVLGLLLLKAGAPVHRQEIIDALWGDDAPDSMVNLVQTYIGRLRRTINPGPTRPGPSWLTGLGPAYAIHHNRCDIDLLCFRTAVTQARQAATPGQTLQSLLNALRLWQGPCLSDLDHTPNRHPWVRAIDQERITVLLETARTALHLNLATEVLPHLQAVAATEHLNEAVHSWLILALAASGAQAEALTAYETIRTRLLDELGIDPGPQLRAAHLRILRQETTHPHPSAPPATAIPPSMLPADIADFTGREKPATQLRATLTDRRPGPLKNVLITGAAGTGKTTLAVHVAHQLSETYPDGQLYADLRGTDPHPADPARILARFLLVLGIPEPAIPQTADERADLYRCRLAGRRILVVLDNATGQEQLKPLLPGSPTCTVIATSRSRLAGLPGAHITDLDVMTPQEAEDMLTTVLGHERTLAEPEATTHLAQLCGGLPLALRAAATRLASRPHWKLTYLAERLTRNGLDELALPCADPRAAIAAGHRRIDPAAQRAFRLLGLLDIPSFTVWTAAATLESSMETTEELLCALTDARLLEATGPDTTGHIRYRFHRLVRLYAREHATAQESEQSARAAITRALASLLALAREADDRLTSRRCTPIRGRAPSWPPPAHVCDRFLAAPHLWFESELPCLVEAVSQACANGLDELAWELAGSLANITVLWERWGELEQAHETALAACRQAGNRLGEAVMLRGLAELDHVHGRGGRCLDRLALARDLFAGLGVGAGIAEAEARLEAVRCEEDAGVRDVFPTGGIR
ncbi:AfsR/SARP family transcriptional regulator [Streptosporangium sp. NPDC051022]|uniref:AfsR/SARP family transcriptional regulator n=1 Tax=Streptosporangium sp. NPDC051022 TaxID=3155752 RepID=UPI00342D94D9